MTATKVSSDDVGPTEAAKPALSIGKGPRTRKPRRRRRMLTGVSRQRRAANARERRRIQGVNDAFVELKSIIPVMSPDDVSKMETLQLAAKWIAYLTTLLIEDDRRRKWSPETNTKCLPATTQERMAELLTFEIEDFVLVRHSCQRAIEQAGQAFVDATAMNAIEYRLQNIVSEDSGESDATECDSEDTNDPFPTDFDLSSPQSSCGSSIQSGSQDFMLDLHAFQARTFSFSGHGETGPAVQYSTGVAFSSPGSYANTLFYTLFPFIVQNKAKGRHVKG